MIWSIVPGQLQDAASRNRSLASRPYWLMQTTALQQRRIRNWSWLYTRIAPWHRAGPFEKRPQVKGLPAQRVRARSLSLAARSRFERPSGRACKIIECGPAFEDIGDCAKVIREREDFRVHPPPGVELALGRSELVGRRRSGGSARLRRG